MRTTGCGTCYERAFREQGLTHNPKVVSHEEDLGLAWEERHPVGGMNGKDARLPGSTHLSLAAFCSSDCCSSHSLRYIDFWAMLAASDGVRRSDQHECGRTDRLRTSSFMTNSWSNARANEA